MDSGEEEFLRSHRSHDVDWMLRRWRKVARSARLTMETIAEDGGYPVVALTNRGRVDDRPGLYVSAGIHGDEPGAGMGLLQWAEENPDFLRSHPVAIVPCVNPWGLTNNSREDREGRDLNRSFDRGGGEVVCALLDFIADREFAVAVNLHEDYDANGVYIYELARRGETLSDELLSRAEEYLPRHRGQVEGRPAKKGILRRTRGLEELADEIEGMPEAIYLYLHHARMALTFETPSEFSLYRRAMAQVRVLEGVAEAVAGAC